MVTPIRADTFKQLGFNAGILLKNFDYSSATDSASLATLIASAITAGTSLLGGTKGGVNIATNTTFWKPEIDGMRMDFKGEQQMDNAECKMSGTLVELTASNFKDVLALADNTTSGNITTIQPRFSITDDDYIDHIIWVGDHGSDGLYLVDLKNALNTSGLNMQTTDKDIATLPFEFTGHADSVSSTTLPITIKLFSKAAAGHGG